MYIKPCIKCGGKLILKISYESEQLMCNKCGFIINTDDEDYYKSL